MNLKIYQKETLRTFAYRKDSLNTSITDMLHCAIGIGTEVGELIEAFEKKDTVNIGEEIADQMWYISNLANFIKFDLYNEVTLTKTDMYESEKKYIDKSVVLSSELLDIFKKSIFYNKELDLNKIKQILAFMIFNLYDLSNSIDLKLEELLDKNIAKLKIRFPDKFTEENAENRNLDEERKALEN